MPKETFFNLPAEKREHITNIAIEEFGDKEYSDVSISRIVARAGIAKGSFYQYFEDKEDLFGYLLDLIMQTKWKMFSLDSPDPEHIGVFRYLHWMAQTSIQFELAYPKLLRVGYRAMSRNLYPEAFQTRAQREAHAFYCRLVALGKEQGDIPPHIDEDLAAYVFSAIFMGLGQYIWPRILARYEAGQGQSVLSELPEFNHIFAQTIDILERGMGSSRPAREPTGNGDLHSSRAQEEVTA